MSNVEVKECWGGPMANKQLQSGPQLRSSQTWGQIDRRHRQVTNWRPYRRRRKRSQMPNYQELQLLSLGWIWIITKFPGVESNSVSLSLGSQAAGQTARREFHAATVVAARVMVVGQKFLQILPASCFPQGHLRKFFFLNFFINVKVNETLGNLQVLFSPAKYRHLEGKMAS